MESVVKASAKANALPTLEELLKSPRGELAKLGDEALREIQLREKAGREGKLRFKLMDLHLPAVWPGFQDMTFAAELGISIPSYLDAKSAVGDEAVARRYARLGDHEAALKLADPDKRGKIEAGRSEVNYPIEWTRVAALQNYAIQQRIAMEDEEGVRLLLDWRSQVENALNEKAKQGPLGQALLPRGRRTLQLAAEAWRKRGDATRAARAENALKDWPAAVDPVVEGFQAAKKTWLAPLKSPAQGRVISVNPPARALDMLGLPFPTEDIDAALFCFDIEDRLFEVLLTYGPRAQNKYPLAADFAGMLSEWAPPYKESTSELCIQRWGNLRCETYLCRQSPTLGAWVRIMVDRRCPAVSLPRELAGIHLDRSFQSNRLMIAPNEKGETIVVVQPKDLARLANPLPGFPIREAMLRPAPDQSLLDSALVAYEGLKTQNVPPHLFMIPLLAQLGPGRISDEPAGKLNGPHLQMRWVDGQTRTILRVPHGAQETVEIELRDARDPADSTAERLKVVTEFEKIDRERRLKEGKPFQLLPRKVDQLSLHMSRNNATAAMPRGRQVFKAEVPDGFVLINNSPNLGNQKEFPRQIICRFNKEGNLVSARVRYEVVAPTTFGRASPRFVPASFKEIAAYVTSNASSPLLERMTDLPPQNPPMTLARCVDDATELAYTFFPGGYEVLLQDRSAFEGNQPLGPSSYLPRGPQQLSAEVPLGGAKQEVQGAFPTDMEMTAEGAWVIRPPGGVYDAVLVWFEQDKVRRIVARHRITDPKARTTPKDMASALVNRWGLEIKTVGWPWRQDYFSTNPLVLQALTWFDDSTRYRLYWAEAENASARLWSEWRDDTKR